MAPDGTPATGVVLLQMGGPEGPEDLAPFLRALFTDPEMIRLPTWLSPLQGLLGRAYGTWRAGKVQPEYERIGWSSLNATTVSLAKRVEARLDGQVQGVEVAMRYTEPRASTAVARLADRGVDHLAAVTLYPFYSTATTGSSLTDLEAALADHAPDLTLSSVDRWGGKEGFLSLTEAWTRRTLEQVQQTHRDLGRTAILLSAHGIPQAYVEDGDPYLDEVHAAATWLADRLEDRPDVERVVLAFQSDVGPVEWLRPYTDDAIRDLAADGIDTLVVVPFGFVSEHIETLYEIDELYGEVAREAGIDRYLRVPAFDDDPAFADLIAELTAEHLEAQA